MLSRLLKLQFTCDINSNISLLSIVILGTLSAASLFVSPVLIGAMVDILKYSEQQAGYVISAELTGMFLAAFPALYWVYHINWRKALVIAISLMMVGNLISVFVIDFEYLLSLRFLTGLAAGSGMTLCFVIISLTRDPDRTFGFWLFGQLLLGTAGLYVLPELLPEFGYGIVYLLIAIMLVGLIFLIRYLPTRGSTKQNEGSTNKLPLKAGLGFLGLLAIVVFFAGQYSIWVYLDRIGISVNLSSANVGEILAGATIVGMLGALSAALLSTRYGRLLPLCVATILSVLSMFMLLEGFDKQEYILAVCLFSFAFNFIQPYLLASIANIDFTGRLIILTSFANGAGVSIGPALAAILLQFSSYDLVLLVGMILTVLTLILIMKLAIVRN